MAGAWSDRDLRGLVLGELLAQMGGQVLFVVLPWLALELTGNAAVAGLVVSAYGLPNAALGFLLGPVVDRVRASRILVLCATGMAAVLLALFALAAADRLDGARLAAGAVALGCLAAPTRGAVGALVPRLVEARAERERRSRDDRELDEANALASGILRASLVVGPALGGALVAALGSRAPLLAAALGLALGAALYALVREARPPPAPRATPRALLRELVVGLRHLLREPFVLRVALFVFLFDALFNAALDIALPAYAKEVVADARVLGFSASSFGAGALVGAIFYKPLGERKFGPAWLALRVGVPGLALLAAALLASTWPLYIGLALAGLLVQPLNIVLASRMQARTPPDRRGRVLSAFYAASAMAIPFAVFAAGLLVDRFGPVVVLGGVGVAMLVVGAPFVASRVVRAELATA